MKRNAPWFQRSLLVTGVLSAISTLITLRSASTAWLIATSSLCFLALPFTVFLRPKRAGRSGLVHGGIVALVYAFTMPLWGRLWYHEGESGDWRVIGLFIVIGLNFTLPSFRGLTFKKTAA